MKGLAAFLFEQKKPLIIEEIEIPKLAYGQVLVQVLCSGICGSQIGEIDGIKGKDKYLPHLLGHEGAGIVLECGDGVTTIEEGNRVVLHWRKGAGIQSSTPVYYSKKYGEINSGWVTTFNEYAVVSENRVTMIPDNFDPEIGALMGCAVTTGLGVINNNAKVKIGESVVVWGAGGIGLNIIQGASLVSAYPIIAIDLYNNKLKMSEKMGATHMINAKEINPEEEIIKIVGSSGVDVVIENTGNTDIIQRAYNLTSSKGRTILVGVPSIEKETKLYTLPLHFDKILTGSHGGEAKPDIDIPNYIRFHNNGSLKLKQLITQRYTLEQVNEAIKDIRHGKITGRALLTIVS